MVKLLLACSNFYHVTVTISCDSSHYPYITRLFLLPTSINMSGDDNLQSEPEDQPEFVSSIDNDFNDETQGQSSIPTAPPSPIVLEDADHAVEDDFVSDDEIDITDNLTFETPAKKPKLCNRIEWQWISDKQEVVILTPPFDCDDIISAKTGGMNFGMCRKFGASGARGSAYKPYKFPYKWRPKNEFDESAHYGYFMSRKTCILEHDGLMATILNETRVFLLDCNVEFVQVGDLSVVPEILPCTCASGFSLTDLSNLTPNNLEIPHGFVENMAAITTLPGMVGHSMVTRGSM